MSIKSFVQHSGWQEMVSLCSLIRLIGVCADRDQPEFLCSRSDSRYASSPCGHSGTPGGWLTRYRPREVRNSIYRYRKIHIDYRSKFLYRFISSISIIYGNTIRDVNFPTILKCMNTNFQTMFFFSIMSHKVPVVQWFILLKTKATQANRLLFFFFFFLPWSYGAVIFQTNFPHINSAWKHTTGFENKSMCKFSQEL